MFVLEVCVRNRKVMVCVCQMCLGVTWVVFGVLKGSQLNALCPKAIVYCYHEFTLRYLKNLKSFSIRVKEIFEPIVCKNSRRVFAHFRSIFLRKRSLNNVE